MKLFIWYGDGVLQDWTSGQITVIAKNLNHALQLIDEEAGYELSDFDRSSPTNVIELGNKEIEPFVVYTWGGG